MPYKSVKLMMNITTLHTGETSHIPIFINKPDTVGMVLHCYKAALGPGQQRMYCKAARLMQEKCYMYNLAAWFEHDSLY